MASILDDALLVVSELVTNAVRATGITDPEAQWPERTNSSITIRLVGLDNCIIIEVWDASLEEPRVKHAEIDDESGRGLELIGHIARDWGSYLLRSGKVVWAELSISAMSASDLPRRRLPPPSEQPTVTEETHIHDPELLKRVLGGLQRL
ncbi:ATP-binding protein [Candidatus Protofrankia californiensis]|uniref:ATP-binding protein n=1 Tax=Candidatus Protofrankia californiensis TaxID=1839754 RepID=UPI0013ECF22F|nr:ATP-binding protein [Candidatus Protofrankia californiensis]